MAYMRTLHVRSAVLAMVVIASACGGDDDDGGSDPDAAPTDDTDAAVVGRRIVGNILMAEVSVNGVPAAGSGILFGITFTPSDEATPPSYEQNPGSPFACKAYERTPEQFAYAGVDEGTIQVTVPGGPEFPPCNFLPGEGYRCISATGSGGAIAAAAGPAPAFQLTNADVSFGADEIGRHIQISGSAVAENNGMFPIIGGDDTSVTFINPTPGAAAEKESKATYRIVAAAGPAGLVDPLPDSSIPTVDLTAGGEGDVTTFSRTADGFGAAFTLDTESQQTISNIPTDGSEFKVSCAGEGGQCGPSMASGIQVVTTDGPIDGLPPDAMPPPVTKSVLVSCIFLQPDVVVPAAASAVLAASGATRIQTLYARLTPSSVPQDNGQTDVVAGHAVVGISTP